MHYALNIFGYTTLSVSLFGLSTNMMSFVCNTWPSHVQSIMGKHWTVSSKPVTWPCVSLTIIEKYNFTGNRSSLNWNGRLVDIIGILGIKIISPVSQPVIINTQVESYLKILFTILYRCIILVDKCSEVILKLKRPLELICAVQCLEELKN